MKDEGNFQDSNKRRRLGKGGEVKVRGGELEDNT